MKSVQTRVLELITEPGTVGPWEWTGAMVAAYCHCSYSTARTALKKLFDAGKITRRYGDNEGGTWYYSKVGC